LGCDIHLYIEHKDPRYPGWECFGRRIFPDRDYNMFAAMAGVRNYDDVAPVSMPKGIPEGISWQVNDDNTLFVSDESSDCEGYCSKEKAKEWAQRGISKKVGDYRVTHPDWHSHSWLNTGEYEKALNSVSVYDSEYKVILVVMKEFEKLGEEARIVFWFDN